MGTIVKHGAYIAYTVKSIENLTQVIIPHFNSFPLLTKKYAGFESFKQIVAIMANKGHLISNSFEKILSLRANLNLGMSEKLKKSFPDIMPVPRIEVPFPVILEPNWLTGFIDGEGCFFINLQRYVYKRDK